MNRQQRRALAKPSAVLHRLRTMGCDCEPRIVPTPGVPLSFDVVHRDGCAHASELRPYVEAGYLPCTFVAVRGCER